jgi:hypothetical protein
VHCCLFLGNRNGSILATGLTHRLTVLKSFDDLLGFKLYDKHANHYFGMIDGSNSGQVTTVNFATDLPPLINDLERVSQLPETSDVEVLQQQLLHRQEVLLKVKDYLVFLYDQGEGSGNALASSSVGGVEAIANAVIQELQLKRTEWVAPISQELDQLHAQKQMLERDVYRLNQQYRTILEQFPQQLLSHFQDLLQTQLGKAVELFEQRLRYISSVTHSMPGFEDAGFAASEAQLEGERSQAEHLQAVHQHLDQSLSSLDSTIRAVFSTLEQDIAAYQMSLTDNLRQLHGLQSSQATSVVTTVDEPVVTEPEAAPVVIPTPEAPEVAALVELEVPAPLEEMTNTPLPETERLFAENDFSYQESDFEPEFGTEGETPAMSVAEVPAEDSVREDYLDFAASVTEEGLFGELNGLESDGAIASEETSAPEDLPVESFLFGDPVSPPPEPSVEPEERLDLQSMLGSTDTSSAEAPETESATVKTIQLLTDLLEDGSLNAQETEEEEEDSSDLDGLDLELEGRVIEDLNPDFEEEEEDIAIATVTVLDPDKMSQLAEDLSQFEMRMTSPSEPIDVAATETPSEAENPWDDSAQPENQSESS